MLTGDFGGLYFRGHMGITIRPGNKLSRIRIELGELLGLEVYWTSDQVVCLGKLFKSDNLFALIGGHKSKMCKSYQPYSNSVMHLLVNI